MRNCLPVHNKTLQVWRIPCPISWSLFLLLEYSDLHFPCTLTVGGIEWWHMCNIFHGTSGLKCCKHSCSWNIRIKNSVQTSLFTRSSSWMDKWWCSVGPNHPNIQERGTTCQYFSRKLSYLEKLYLLQDLHFSTQRHCQIETHSKHSLRLRWQISSHSLTTTENWLSTQGGGIHGLYCYV